MIQRQPDQWLADIMACKRIDNEVNAPSFPPDDGGMSLSELYDSDEFPDPD